MCTLKDNLPVKKVVLDDKHPKWDQKAWFIPQSGTMSIQYFFSFPFFLGGGGQL